MPLIDDKLITEAEVPCHIIFYYTIFYIYIFIHLPTMSRCNGLYNHITLYNGYLRRILSYQGGENAAILRLFSTSVQVHHKNSIDAFGQKDS